MIELHFEAIQPQVSSVYMCRMSSDTGSLI